MRAPDAARPTPYPAVNAVLHDLAARIRTILGDDFRGMYLYGSLALGDFDAHYSDIDYLVVTGGEITSEQFQALQEMHAAFDASGSPWAARIEAAYIPQEIVRRSAPTPGNYPQVKKHTRLAWMPLEDGWPFQVHTLREHGVAVVGPALRPLIDPVDRAEMRRAALGIAGDWLKLAQGDAEWLAWVGQRSEHAFVVLTLCRLLYTLQTGAVGSKPAAAAWAQVALDPRWSPLIAHALAGLHDPSETPAEDVAEMIDMIGYAAEWIEQQQPGTTENT